jgi:hypothetical protein
MVVNDIINNILITHQPPVSEAQLRLAGPAAAGPAGAADPALGAAQRRADGGAKRDVKRWPTHRKMSEIHHKNRGLIWFTMV